jgi:hypothetical protein
MSNSDNDNSDNHEYKTLKKETLNVKPKVKKNIGLTLNTLLQKKTTRDPILAINKMPLKKLEKEKEQISEKLKSKKLLNVQRKLGFTDNLQDDYDKQYERHLINITTKGVVKLFNSIYDIKKQEKEEREKEEIIKEKKSRNFLTMHNLNYPNSNNTDKEQPVGKNKTFKEDNY